MIGAAKEEMPALPVVWGESVLLSVADPALLENRIWAKSHVAENSRQGFQLRSSTLRWASSEVKSRTALGLRGTLYDEGIRSRCTGRERDAESGLDYFGARHYGNSLGRFMQPDEAFNDQETGDPQSWNLYSYVRNNPLRYTDPTGNACVQGSDGKWSDDESGASLVLR
jgi:RHS repeat-associated protein